MSLSPPGLSSRTAPKWPSRQPWKRTTETVIASAPLRRSMAGFVEVHVPGPLRDYTDGVASVSIDPGSIADVLHRLDDRHPGICQRILDDQGRVRRHVNLFLNSEPIKGADFTTLEARPGDTLEIIPSVSGG